VASALTVDSSVGGGAGSNGGDIDTQRSIQFVSDAAAMLTAAQSAVNGGSDGINSSAAITM
jgi:hypothetical protein